MPKTLRSPTHCSNSDSDIAKSVKESAKLTRKDKRRRISGGADDSDPISALRNEMRELFEALQTNQTARLDKLDSRITEISSNISFVQNTNQEIEKAVDLVSVKLSTIESTISKLETDRKELHYQLSVLDEKCEVMERNVRKTCVEIRNVPKRPNEKKQDLYNSIHSLMGNLKIKTELSDIRDVYRLPIKATNETTSVIVEYTNTLFKGEVLEAAKKFNRSSMGNQLNSTHLGFESTRTTVYLSEYLTTRSKKLYFLARNFAKAEKYAYCWSSNGKIYLRKKEGDRYTLIKNEEQLVGLKAVN